MSHFPLQQSLQSGASPIQPRPRRRRPHPLAIAFGYWVAFMLLHFGASAMSTTEGALFWYYPAALSVTLLLILGPKYLPIVLLAPLPIDLLLRPMGLSPWAILGMTLSFGVGHALAVMAFRRAGLSARLRSVRDVAGFLVLVVLGPLLAVGPVYLLLDQAGVFPPDQLLGGVRTLFLGDVLGVLTLAPALLLWARPLLTLGGLPLRSWRSSPGRGEFLLQVVGMAVGVLVVTRFSQPGTFHLKYLLFLPMFWMVLRGGMRRASLGFLILSLVFTLVILQRGPTGEAILGIQSFLVVLFGAALFLGSTVEAHDAVLVIRDRASHRLRQLVESTGAIAWEMDLGTGRSGYLGRDIEARFGWPQDTWRRTPFWGEVVHPEDQLGFLKFLLEVSRPGGNRQFEFRLRLPGGGDHWVRAAGGPEPEHPQGRVMGFLFDIHAHKWAEENALRASLKEKDLLLREIHHRVKNNLQVVSSLLRLQASTQQDPAIHHALQEAQERVQAIALIHQKLKHAPDFSQLDLPGYVRTLVERLVRSYASVPALIDLQVRVAEVDLGPDAPVPLGLILNELVANALQHAFPPGEGGSLDIDITQDEKGWITLRVADSGQGLPESVDLGRGGLGFQLVQALTDQLGGTLELERRRGASFLVSFPSAQRHP